MSSLAPHNRSWSGFGERRVKGEKRRREERRGEEWRGEERKREERKEDG